MSTASRQVPSDFLRYYDILDVPTDASVDDIRLSLLVRELMNEHRSVPWSLEKRRTAKGFLSSQRSRILYDCDVLADQIPPDLPALEPAHILSSLSTERIARGTVAYSSGMELPTRLLFYHSGDLHQYRELYPILTSFFCPKDTTSELGIARVCALALALQGLVNSSIRHIGLSAVQVLRDGKLFQTRSRAISHLVSEHSSWLAAQLASVSKWNVPDHHHGQALMALLQLAPLYEKYGSALAEFDPGERIVAAPVLQRSAEIDSLCQTVNDCPSIRRRSKLATRKSKKKKRKQRATPKLPDIPSLRSSLSFIMDPVFENKLGAGQHVVRLFQRLLPGQADRALLKTMFSGPVTEVTEYVPDIGPLYIACRAMEEPSNIEVKSEIAGGSVVPAKAELEIDPQVSQSESPSVLDSSDTAALDVESELPDDSGKVVGTTESDLTSIQILTSLTEEDLRSKSVSEAVQEVSLELLADVMDQFLRPLTSRTLKQVRRDHKRKLKAKELAQEKERKCAQEVAAAVREEQNEARKQAKKVERKSAKRKMIKKVANHLFEHVVNQTLAEELAIICQDTLFVERFKVDPDLVDVSHSKYHHDGDLVTPSSFEARTSTTDATSLYSFSAPLPFSAVELDSILQEPTLNESVLTPLSTLDWVPWQSFYPEDGGMFAKCSDDDFAPCLFSESDQTLIEIPNPPPGVSQASHFQ